MKFANRLLLSLLVAGLMTVLPALAQQGSSSPINQGSNPDAHIASSSAPASTGSIDQADAQFLAKAAQDDIAEVQLGQLALQKSDNKDVKKLATQIVDDHMKDLDQVKAIAQQKSVPLPTTPDSEAQKTIADLQQLQGGPFDTAYLNFETKDHSEEVPQFQQESKQAQDPAVKEYAKKDVAVLSRHLQMAQGVAAPTAGPPPSGARDNNEKRRK